MSHFADTMEPIVDVCLLYDLACASCGRQDDVEIYKDLGVVLCDRECFENYLEQPDIREEPKLTDVEQCFWSDIDQGYIIAASLGSLKRKTKSKAKKAKRKADFDKRRKEAAEKARKSREEVQKKAEEARKEAREKRDEARRKAEEAKRKGQSKAEEAKSKVKKGAREAKSKAEEGASKAKKGFKEAGGKAKEGASEAQGALEDAGEGAAGLPGGAGGEGFAPADVPQDLLGPEDFESSSDYEDYLERRGVREVFSLRYLLDKHHYVGYHLDAGELLDFRQYGIVAGEFGQFLVDFAISALATEQNNTEVAETMYPMLLESEARLESVSEM